MKTNKKKKKTHHQTRKPNETVYPEQQTNPNLTDDKRGPLEK